VKSIALAEDRKGVVVTAELTKQAEDFLVEDTRFWVVRPRVAGGSVSGIGTLFSGAYIGFDAGKSAVPRREFTGLETPPVVTAGLPGRHFILTSEDLGFLDIGAPIYFRRIPVGQVVAFELDKDGAGVTFKIFINAPYDRYVTGNTRFWQASGVDVTLDAGGFRVNTESLALDPDWRHRVQTPADSVPAPQARENTAFTLFADRALALKHPDTVVETYRLVFKESVRGLSVGAPVDFRGFVIGEVAALNIELDPATNEVGMVVHIYLYPERFRRRNAGAQLAMDSKAILDAMVARGLRAQLRTGNLLTGQLYVALDFFPKASKAKLDWNSKPVELPIMPASLQELQATLAEITKKLEKVPFEGIGIDLRQTLQSLDRTLQNTDRLVQRVDKDVAPQARARDRGCTAHLRRGGAHARQRRAAAAGRAHRAARTDTGRGGAARARRLPRPPSRGIAARQEGGATVTRYGIAMAALCVAAAAGCGSTPKAHFYTLSAVPAAAGATAPSATAGYGVAVGPITVPEAVDRPQIVVRLSPSQVEISELHRWAAPLKSEIPASSPSTSHACWTRHGSGPTRELRGWRVTTDPAGGRALRLDIG